MFDLGGSRDRLEDFRSLPDRIAAVDADRDAGEILVPRTLPPSNDIAALPSSVGVTFHPIFERELGVPTAGR
jgi:hypothetical protein